MHNDIAEPADVIVIGAGIAGITAALSAVEHGLEVLLLEKTDAIGGSSAMSGGWFAFAGTEEQAAAGVEDSRELYRADLLQVGAHRNDPRLIDAFLDEQLDTYRWLRTHGVEFGEVEISSGQSAKRGHSTRIREVLRRLHDDYRAAGGRTLFEHRARWLVRDDSGTVTGVTVETPAGGVELRSRFGVVIASGGFSRSRSLLQTFAPEQLAAIPYGGRANEGDGLLMGWRLGAGLADMSSIAATYGSHPETGEEQHELLTAFYMGAIIVNTEGRRFVDESLDYKTLGSAVVAQPEALAFEIFDAPVRAKSRRGVALKDMDTIADLGHLHEAPTVAELAPRIGVDPDQLEATIRRYNEAIAGLGVDEVGRSSLCNGVGELTPIATGPFYAYPAKPLMTTTYGGLTVSPSAEVIDVAGERIAGLYAIGEVVGGFHGAAYMTGTSLGKGAVFGRIAAAQIAEAAADA